MPYSQLSLDGKRTNQEIRVGGFCGEEGGEKRMPGLAVEWKGASESSITGQLCADDICDNYFFCDLFDNRYKFPLPFTRDHSDPVMKDLTKKV